MNTVAVGVTDWIEEKNCLLKIALCQQTKTADDNDDNKVAMCIKKNHNNQPNCSVHRSNDIEWSHH